MLSGLHTVADIFCCCCGQIVGWKYVMLPLTCLFFIQQISQWMFQAKSLRMSICMGEKNLYSNMIYINNAYTLGRKDLNLRMVGTKTHCLTTWPRPIFDLTLIITIMILVVSQFHQLKISLEKNCYQDFRNFFMYLNYLCSFFCSSLLSHYF